MSEITFLNNLTPLEIYKLTKANKQILNKDLLIKYYLFAIEKTEDKELIGNSFFEIGCIYAELEDYANMGKYLSLARQNGHEGCVKN